ncbi:hypothetical protein RRG08_043079 [Elysia crispata]|uniref:Uncharacterized protein n=1 Tax=Elysia crispata TaxID=231223 RepID=A0AAE1CPG4_9GAST|nr:hypothetical protein RRG08_043079 [Elysia crispata]
MSNEAVDIAECPPPVSTPPRCFRGKVLLKCLALYTCERDLLDGRGRKNEKRNTRAALLHQGPCQVIG